MANVPLGHHSHTVLARIAGTHVIDRVRHDVAHLGAARRAVLQDDFAGIVALGHHAQHGIALYDHHRADAALGHGLDGVVHR
ncbi:hypothetical protein G6F68_018618 [Rhizopus microsporus]|nr:hypothetical protein G6F68_018618 [Rhizopus microsporus]